MSNEIIGIRRSEGTSKKTGKPYSGYVVFYKFTQDGVEGYACDNIFVADQVLNGSIPHVGDLCSMSYNRNGYLTDFQLM